MCHKWHYKLAKSFIVCLESNDYIQIRNVLQVLTVLLPIYPKMTAFYAALERRIRAICLAEKDRRHDLFALAKCYSGRLAQKYKDMIEESLFHTVPERVAPAIPTSATTTTTTTTATASTNGNSHAGRRYDQSEGIGIGIDSDQIRHRLHHPILELRIENN